MKRLAQYFEAQASKAQAENIREQPLDKARSVRPARARHPRLPEPGTIITKQYQGTIHEVKVLEQGFEHQGKYYSSLSALAMCVHLSRNAAKSQEFDT